jgi:hypothetical protein
MVQPGHSLVKGDRGVAHIRICRQKRSQIFKGKRSACSALD